MDACPPSDRFLQEAARLGVLPEESVLARLQQFVEQVYKTNRAFNLTAIRDPEMAWMRHVLDSLVIEPLLPEEGRVMDIGSGGGFPGMVLAVVRPDLEWALVEATGKKATFLAEAAADLALPPDRFRVVHGRSEDLCHDPEWRHTSDAVTARGVGPLRELMEYTLPLVRPGGALLAMKGARADEEIKAAAGACHNLEATVEKVALPGVGGDACVVRARIDREIPAVYPRAFGMIRKNPL